MNGITRIGSAWVLSSLLFAAVTCSTAGAADNTFPIKATVNAKTTIKKLNQTVVIPQGTFVGSIDTTKGRISGKLKLPAASSTVMLAGIGLAKATFSMVPTKQVSGTIDFSTLDVHATSTFNILVTSVKPLGTSLNVVGSSCKTSTPVSLKFSGVISPISGGTFSGTYTIPSLANCGLSTIALNELLAGPGNTFTAQMIPA
jgi:hypothetical protein